MNIEQANAIRLSEILQKIGAKIVKTKGNEIWYNSPFRNEMTASLHINIAKNIWYDFGEAAGGDVIALVTTYLKGQGEDYTVVDALRWMRNMMIFQPVVVNIEKEVQKEPSTLKIITQKSIESRTLIKYLDSRKIPLEVAKKYLQEVHILNNNSGKVIRALGIGNEADGMELRNKFFKGCIGAKNITFIRGAALPVKEIHLFEGFIDYLSAVMKEPSNQFNGDVIILNSVACLPLAFPYIKNYHYLNIFTWFDNDTAGENATKTVQKFAENMNYGFLSKSNLYSPHKDVNDWVRNEMKGLN